MKTLLLSSLVGLTLVAASASAAPTTEQNSVWKRSATAPVESVEQSSETETKAWRRIRFSKVDVNKTEEAKKAWRRIRF